MARNKKSKAIETVIFLAGIGMLAGGVLGLRQGLITIGAMEIEKSGSGSGSASGSGSGSGSNGVLTALTTVAKNYGVSFARRLEQLLRLETRHFESDQWLQCHSAGMVVFSSTFPYGWGSLSTWAQSVGLDPGSFSTKEFFIDRINDYKSFIVFPSNYSFILFLAWFIRNERGDNFAAWYSNNASDQAAYNHSLDSITPRLTNQYL